MLPVDSIKRKKWGIDFFINSLTLLIFKRFFIWHNTCIDKHRTYINNDKTNINGSSFYMENSSIIALSYQTGLRRKIDIIANNIANLSTTGFKAERVMFIEHLERSRGVEGQIIPRLHYVRDIATRTDPREGPITKTGNPLDIAIQGDGYFVIDSPEGELYTRNGHFNLDNSGQLVNQAGNPVLTDAGAPVIFAPEDTRIIISRDGTISTNNGELGKLKVVQFKNDQKLNRVQGAQFSANENDPPVPVDTPIIIQSSLEGSNVESLIEMTELINLHRTYDAVKDFIERDDKRQRLAITELPKVA